MTEPVRDILAKILQKCLNQDDLGEVEIAWCLEVVDALKPHIVTWAVNASQDYAKHAFDLGVAATLDALHAGGLLDHNEHHMLMEGLRQDGATGIGVRVPNLEWDRSV